MSYLRDINDVEVVEQLTGEEKVLVNVDGSAKQMAVGTMLAGIDKGLQDVNKGLQDVNKGLQDVNKRFDELQEWDLYLTVVADRYNEIFEIENVDHYKGFAELKTKIINGDPLNIRLKVAVNLGNSENALWGYSVPSLLDTVWAPGATEYDVESIGMLGFSVYIGHVEVLLNSNDEFILQI